MGKNSAVSDEQLIASLLQSGTMKEAAAAAGISERSLYNRMNERGFRQLYSEAKNEVYRSAVYNINSKLSAAVDAVFEIMNDNEVNAAIRLQAAQTLINNAGKFSDRLRQDEFQARQDGIDPNDPAYFGIR